MYRYVIRRLIFAIPCLILLSAIVFFSIRMVPGDALMQMIQDDIHPPPERLAAMRHEMGLDVPAWKAYPIWLANVARGDLGNSLYTRRPVTAEILKRIPVTLELAIFALTVSTAIAIPFGIISAARQESLLDYALRLVAVTGLAMPSFWLGTLLLVLPAFWFKWAPPLTYESIWQDPMSNLKQFMLPALSLGFMQNAAVMRMTRSCLLEVLRSDYIRTAWAKGLMEKVVIVRHALKNALIPVVTMTGGQAAFLLGGTVITETIFSLPGLGRLTITSIEFRDYTQLQGNVLFIGMVVILMNLLVDTTYAWLDPRIRYR